MFREGTRKGVGKRAAGMKMHRRMMFLGPAALFGVVAILDTSDIDPLLPLRRKPARIDHDEKNKLVLRKMFELFRKIELPEDLYMSTEDARRMVAGEIFGEWRNNPSLNNLLAFENIRNRQMAAGRLTYLDG